jgi:branched-chain amino acid transport system permease protein
VGIIPVLIIAPFIAGIIALVVGSTFSKFRDDYFMLATLGFLMIFNTVARNWEGLTGGSYGIAGVYKPVFLNIKLSSPDTFFILALIVLIITFLVIHFLSASAFGRVLRAIREDEDALQVFGYRTSVYKLMAFIISAAFMSMAGVLFASYLTFIDSNLFTINESILLWAMIILGGIGNNKGALLGAFILIILPEVLRFIGFPVEFAGLLRQFIYGALLVILMLFRRKGLWGDYKL